jgi:alpha-L-fucosidase
MMKTHITVKIVLTVFVSLFILADTFSQQKFTKEEIEKYTAGKEERLKWMKESRFGLFIHWGVYSLTSDEWDGQRYTGESCFVMEQANIPVKEYIEKVAKPFNPVKFDADKWVQIARNAGMKYIIITAKHVDGFAMYGSRASPFNIVDGTAYKKDPILELRKACDKYGLKLGFYYSQHWDWLHPHALAQMGKDRYKDNFWDWPDRSKKDPEIYYREKSYKQVEELVTGYNPAIMWFDVPGSITPEQSYNLLKIVRSNKPYCIINNRIGNNMGDYGTPEQTIPTESPDFFEVCMTIQDNWGYSFFDRQFKSPQTIIHNLVDIASKGGNYLLNVGPTSEGVFPSPAVRVLEEVGTWMAVNGESIYETTACPSIKLPFDGRCTMKPGKLFINIFEWPVGEQVIIPGIKSKIKKVYFLNDTEQIPLDFENLDDAHLLVELKNEKVSRNLINPYSTVIVIEYSGDLLTVSSPAIIDPAYCTLLDPKDARIKGTTLKYSFNPVWGKGRGYNIYDWLNTEETVEWKINSPRGGEFDIELSYGAVEGCSGNEFAVSLGDQEIKSNVQPTGDWYDYRNHLVGRILVKTNSENVLVIQPVKTTGFSLMNLKSVRFLPIVR